MDGPNIQAIYERGCPQFKEITYLPVPVINYSGRSRNTKPSGDFCITYLGRGNDNWKIYPLIKVLEDLNKSQIRTNLSIITDKTNLFADMIEKYIPYNKVNIEFVTNLYGETLENYMLNYSTLHIAMGTSALEGAKLGIPTILIDYSKQKFPDSYKYRWLYQCEDYCLAGEIKDGVLPYNNGVSLEEVLQTISSDERYIKESGYCKSYIENNHSIHFFVNQLEKSCERSRMTTQKYCDTTFSQNMYKFQKSPIKKIASAIKRSLIGNKYDV